MNDLNKNIKHNGQSGATDKEILIDIEKILLSLRQDDPDITERDNLISNVIAQTRVDNILLSREKEALSHKTGDMAVILKGLRDDIIRIMELEGIPDSDEKGPSATRILQSIGEKLSIHKPKVEKRSSYKDFSISELVELAPLTTLDNIIKKGLRDIIDTHQKEAGEDTSKWSNDRRSLWDIYTQMKTRVRLLETEENKRSGKIIGGLKGDDSGQLG